MNKDMKTILDAIHNLDTGLSKRIDGVESKIKGIQTTLDEHGKTLARLDKSADTDRNKRVDLELRVTAIERHLGIKKKIAA